MVILRKRSGVLLVRRSLFSFSLLIEVSYLSDVDTWKAHFAFLFAHNELSHDGCTESSFVIYLDCLV